MFTTYNCSFVGTHVAIQPMPEKPDELLPVSQDDVGAPAPVNAPIAFPAPTNEPAQPLGPIQVEFKYPDGTTEVMDLVNGELVRSVARANRRITAPSASYPQTMTPQPLATSSLPAVSAVDPGTGLSAAISLPSQSSSQLSDTSAGRDIPDATDPADPTPGTSGSGPSRKRKSDGKNVKGKYQSKSTPLVRSTPPPARFDPRRLFSNSMMR